MINSKQFFIFAIIIIIAVYLSTLVDVKLSLIVFLAVAIGVIYYIYNNTPQQEIIIEPLENAPVFTNINQRMNDLRLLVDLDLESYERALEEMNNFIENYKSGTCDIVDARGNLNSIKSYLRSMYVYQDNSEFNNKLASLIKDLEDYYEEIKLKCQNSELIVEGPIDGPVPYNYYASVF